MEMTPDIYKEITLLIITYINSTSCAQYVMNESRTLHRRCAV